MPPQISVHPKFEVALAKEKVICTKYLTKASLWSGNNIIYPQIYVYMYTK